MAEGIRIRPRPGLKWPDNAVIAVTDHARPIPDPPDGTPLEEALRECPLCDGKKHFAKTYHLQLRAGSVIVSTVMWDRLQGLAENPFEFVNVVADPPAQGLFPGTERPPALIEKFVMPIATPN